MSSLIGTQQHRPSGPGSAVTDERSTGRGTQCGHLWRAAEWCTGKEEDTSESFV